MRTHQSKRIPTHCLNRRRKIIHSNSVKIVSHATRITNNYKRMAMEFGKMLGCSKDKIYVEKEVPTINQNKELPVNMDLKELLLIHLDLIEQLNEENLAKDDIIKSQKQQNKLVS